MKKTVLMAGLMAAMMAWGGEKVALVRLADGGTLAKSAVKLGEHTGNQALGVMAAAQLAKLPWVEFFGQMRADSAMSLVCFAEVNGDQQEGIAVIYPIQADKENFKARHEGVEETQEGVMRVKGNPLGPEAGKMMGEETWVKFSEDGKWAVASDTLERMYAGFEELKRAGKSMEGNWIEAVVLPRGMEIVKEEFAKLAAEEEDEEERALGEKLVERVKPYQEVTIGSKISDLGLELNARALTGEELAEQAEFAATELLPGAVSVAEVSETDMAEMGKAWAAFAEACAAKGAPVGEVLKMVIDGDDCRITIGMNKIVELAAKDGEELKRLDAALKEVREGTWLKGVKGGFCTGGVGKVHKYALELDNYQMRYGAAERLLRVIPEVEGKRLSVAAAASGMAIVQSLAEVLKAAAGDAMDEEDAMLIAMMPEEVPGGFALAQWREGREERWILRVSGDEARAISNMAMMIVIPKIMDGFGVTAPGGIGQARMVERQTPGT